MQVTSFMKNLYCLIKIGTFFKKIGERMSRFSFIMFWVVQSYSYMICVFLLFIKLLIELLAREQKLPIKCNPQQEHKWLSPPSTLLAFKTHFWNQRIVRVLPLFGYQSKPIFVIAINIYSVWLSQWSTFCSKSTSKLKKWQSS